MFSVFALLVALATGGFYALPITVGHHAPVIQPLDSVGGMPGN